MSENSIHNKEEFTQLDPEKPRLLSRDLTGFTRSLSDVLRGKVVFVGIGNILRGDDGLGPVFVDRLRGKVPAVCIDAGSAPENYAGKVIKESPNTIVLVDAAHLGCEPGSYELLGKEDILRSGFSTHDLSPGMLMEFLEEGTGARIYMLAIQPENVSLGEGMSESVKIAVEELAELMISVLK